MTKIIQTYWDKIGLLFLVLGALWVVFKGLGAIGKKKQAKIVQMDLPVLDECEDAISN